MTGPEGDINWIDFLSNIFIVSRLYHLLSMVRLVVIATTVSGDHQSRVGGSHDPGPVVRPIDKQLVVTAEYTNIV